MGYSAATAAFNTIENILAMKKSTMSNVFCDWRNRMVFWERGKEHADGAMTGTVYRSKLPNDPAGTNGVVRIGSFRIEPSGRIDRFPGLTAHEVRCMNAKSKAARHDRDYRRGSRQS